MPIQNTATEFLNIGDSDAALQGPPSQFLLIRGLEPNVTEELLAKGVSKLYKPSTAALQAGVPGTKKTKGKVASTTGDSNLGAKEGSIRRVLLVRDRMTNESWRYGFAEFGSVEVFRTPSYGLCYYLFPPGCTSRSDALQLLREIHDIFEACQRIIYPPRCLCTCI